MSTLSIHIAKAGKYHIEVNTDELPEDMYKLALEEGLKVLLNARMSKVGSVTKLEGEALTKAHEAAKAIAHENLEKLVSGKLVKGHRATSDSKVPGIVMTEARRLAKEVVKNEIKAAGFKISHVPAKDITAMANKLIADDASYIEQAKINIEARSKVVAVDEGEAKSKLASLGFNGVSEKLVAKDAAAKADKPLSAKQAGKIAPRQRPAVSATAH